MDAEFPEEEFSRSSRDMWQRHLTRMRVDANHDKPRLVLAILVVASASLHAQWLKYPTAGVPRTPTAGRISPRPRRERPTASRICQVLAAQPRPCPPEGCGDYAVVPSSSISARD